MPTAFDLLHPAVQRTLWDMKWTDLHPIQVEAIQLLLGGTPLDCVIASPTASGKTEAAFLPVLSSIADDPGGGVRALYIGPLKALINDQFGRIEQLCERMAMPVCRWHGDVDDGPRRALLERPAGILLITPESLEAMFVLRPNALPALFSRLAFVVIDEAHAFLGSPRGAQLASQLHRLRVRTKADPIRIALSATLGDMSAAKRWLRGDGRPVRLIQGERSAGALRIRLRGYWRPPPSPDDDSDPILPEVARGILQACHGKTILAFANAKSLIEALADALATQARAIGLPDDIVVHHGSLSKEQREGAEQRLRAPRPCIAVCSNTLELGIDIGDIDEVVQVSAPWSVASLVQRLGRSGRRPGAPRILRGYLIEDECAADASLWDALHLDFVRGLAIVELMIEGWIEAPLVERAHWSTLVQQLLSILAETGGLRAHELLPRLAGSGAFHGLGASDFAVLLRELGKRELIEQLPDGTLVLGVRGVPLVEHYSFYAAFKAPAELAVRFRDRPIGTLPESMLPGIGDHLILAGRRWLVDDIDADRKVVYVLPSQGKKLPGFTAARPDVDPVVHERMRALLGADRVPAYLDATAIEILAKARAAARDLETSDALPIWRGTRVFRTLYLVLASAGIVVEPREDVALVIGSPPAAWRAVLRAFGERPDGLALARFAERMWQARIFDGDKLDAFVPPALWCARYARERLDIDGATRFALQLLDEPPPPPPSAGPACAVIPAPTLSAWAAAIASLDADGPFPLRTAIVPTEAHAHALRRELAAIAPAALAGTRFLTAAAAARAVLDHAEVRYRLNEEARRPLRVRGVLRAGLSLRVYGPALCSTAGWEQAFADTLVQLEAAGLAPADLDRVGDDRATDLASIWRAVDAAAGDSWTTPRAIAEAAALLDQDPSRWPFAGATLAPISVGIDAGHARLLRAIPRFVGAIAQSRPPRRHALDRVATLFGGDAAAAMSAPGFAAARGDEHGLLAELLFETPERRASCRRSAGPDGTVSLEQYAGVDEELAAAARWITDEVMRGTPLGELAILTPAADPIGALVADRIRGLAWPAGIQPVYLAAGRPAVATAIGARVLAVIEALAAWLPFDAVVGLLPRLRLDAADAHLSTGDARAIAHELATAGGSAARPEGALEWRRASARAELASVRPALDALVAIAEQLVGGASLAIAWGAIRAFLASHVRGGAALDEIIDVLAADVRALAEDAVAAELTGPAAVAWLGERLRALRVRDGRFGDPAIFVGSISSAAGLRFTAIRVVGLAEGAFPGTLREDAILPRALRAQLPAFALPSDHDYATGRLHALHQLVRDTRARVVLSTPRVDFEGAERAHAAVFVEALAALGRPDPREPLRAYRRPLVVSMPLDPVVDPQVIAASAARLDGALGAAPLTRVAWGLAETHPLSASSLAELLECPQRFLMKRILALWPRREPPSLHRIDPRDRGALLHRVLEDFATAHGAAFASRAHDLVYWLQAIGELTTARFAAFRATSPVTSVLLLDAAHRRLVRDARRFVELEWAAAGSRRFIEAEREFACALPTPSGPLFVKGALDRLDVQQGRSLVRDFKTGRPRPRVGKAMAPDLAIDAQLALYANVVRHEAPAWGVPGDVAAAYVYLDQLSAYATREFVDDRAALLGAGERWLDLASRLVREQHYAKASDPAACDRCAFHAVCARTAADPPPASGAALELWELRR
ncbi:MAG TPA: DEAD/DEAH box helicase [Kofleriaceae bacterium]|jgi:ATP-dependent Lhr-like helicase